MLYIMDNLVKYFNEYSLNNSIKVIVNTCEIPGEGEHKIISYIKDNISNDKIILIHGSDNDYIPLLLPLSNKNIILTRTKHNGKLLDFNNYVYISINNIKNHIPSILKIKPLKFNNYNSSSCTNNSESSSFRNLLAESKSLADKSIFEEEYLTRCVYDFIALIGLAGTDFIPSSPSIRFSGLLSNLENSSTNLLENHLNNKSLLNSIDTKSNNKLDLLSQTYNSIDNLFIIYNKEIKNNNLDLKESSDLDDKFNENTLLEDQWLVEKDGRLNCVFLRKILISIGNDEKNWFNRLYSNNDLIKKNTVEPVYLNKEGYKERWYKIKFNVEYNQSNLTSIFNSYLKVLSWYVLLYINGIYNPNNKNHLYTASWDMYYPYLYSPLMSDIKNVNISKYYTFNISKPISTELQHLLVFSKYFLGKIDIKYKDIILKYPNYYPSIKDIKIDYELSDNKEYKSILILPFIQISKLKNILNK